MHEKTPQHVARVTSLRPTTACDFKWPMLLPGGDHWGLASAWRQAEHGTAWQHRARRPPSLHRSLEQVNSRARMSSLSKPAAKQMSWPLLCKGLSLHASSLNLWCQIFVLCKSLIKSWYLARGFTGSAVRSDSLYQRLGLFTLAKKEKLQALGTNGPNSRTVNTLQAVPLEKGNPEHPGDETPQKNKLCLCKPLTLRNMKGTDDHMKTHAPGDALETKGCGVCRQPLLTPKERVSGVFASRGHCLCSRCTMSTCQKQGNRKRAPETPAKSTTGLTETLRS